MKSLLSYTFAILLSISLQAQNRLEELTRQLVNDEIFEKAYISLAVKEVGNEELIVSFDPEKFMIPASSLKLITNFSALKLLGKDYRFITRILTDGKLAYDGSLRGNLIISGGADPSLGSSEFKGVRNLEKLLEKINGDIINAGIKCIEGDIIIDDTIIEKQGSEDNWQWNDIGNYYGGGAWSINIHENTHNVYFDTNGKEGERAKVLAVYPQIKNLDYKSFVNIASPGTGDNAYVYGSPFDFEREIRGTLPHGKSNFMIKASLPDPPLLFAQLIKDRLIDSGIAAGDIRREKIVNKKLKSISIIESPKLERIVYMSNLHSNNLYSESLFKMTGIKQMGSSDDALDAVKLILDKYSLNTDSYRAVDGAGLSRQNFVTSELLASFMASLIKDMGAPKVCRLMAQPGTGGTLKYILADNKMISKNIWIKTGSMKAVQSYTGVLRSQNGKYYTFSIIANNFSASNSLVRKRFDGYLESLYELL
jgi:D-alanyl-D-alanine carboxypeptidase/D-alanyl-D-alanine-endopeptidase (penicillin-binding protein 4)